MGQSPYAGGGESHPLRHFTLGILSVFAHSLIEPRFVRFLNLLQMIWLMSFFAVTLA
jgi:hypothetical protein